MENASLRDQYVEVGIGNERYALGIDEISEIIKMQEITTLPGSKSYVRGVINLRGKIVPIISLRLRFFLPDEPDSKSTRIVVVNHADELVGIVVDRVNQVVRFAEIKQPPERIGSVSGSYFSGIGHTDSGLVSILKLDQVLQD